jgi:hypothetical protein
MYAAFRRLGYEKTQSAQAPLWVFVSATFFCARETALQFLLSGTKKRHIQPGRYMPFVLKFLELWIDKIEK